MELPSYNWQSKILTPFYPAVLVKPSKEHIRGMAEHFGTSVTKAKVIVADELAQPTFKNGDRPSDYQVRVKQEEEGVIWLSIKRIDKGPCHDWRHFQEIKNMIIGPEHEAVELYPAESRVVDTANQYHLWVAADPEFRFPFGFSVGKKLEGDIGNSKQRSFET